MTISTYAVDSGALLNTSTHPCGWASLAEYQRSRRGVPSVTLTADGSEQLIMGGKFRHVVQLASATGQEGGAL